MVLSVLCDGRWLNPHTGENLYVFVLLFFYYHPSKFFIFFYNSNLLVKNITKYLITGILLKLLELNQIDFQQWVSMIQTSTCTGQINTRVVSKKALRTVNSIDRLTG
jgi:hypothetical protein